MIDFSNVNQWMVGNTEVVEAALNGTVVWEKPGRVAFYIEDISGSANTISIKKYHDFAPTITIEKSTDGTSWVSMGSTTTSGISVSIPANGRLYLRCNTPAWASSSEWVAYNTITSTGNIKVGGNVNSLLYGSSFNGQTEFPSNVDTCALYSLFRGCTTLTDASELLLPATTLVNSCYDSMFRGCTRLTTVPVLPATTLARYCYDSMFYGCTRLTTAPALPATTLAQSCYNYMFYGCTRLTTAPVLSATTLANSCYADMFRDCTSLTTAPALPATTLANSCYASMFRGCTRLTTAPELPATTLERLTGCYQFMFYGCTALTTAPELPATALGGWCYLNMFRGCTSLTTAPKLPATKLTSECYEKMFYGCSNLNYIKCLATDISAHDCLTSWVYNVASSGTFVKDPNMASWSTGDDGIPSGWTVQDATS